ncbi:MAG: YggS family pyridoxal phosphate-dependent enzyme [Planctomycetes bacterium]|nr:YggS family pyridoxal phosphate-dependent enzyme [Planctomycetota bacterium]
MEPFHGINQLRRNLAEIRQNIADACQRAGRSPTSVRLVAVTKYVAPEVIMGLLAAGAIDLGENRVQQLVQRAKALGASTTSVFDDDDSAEAGPAAAPQPRWHMIGHLQRNKIRMLLPHSRTVHALDSLRLADELHKQADQLDVTIDALVEVNIASEQSKFGAAPGEVEPLVTALATRTRIRLRGLMTMAPFNPEPEAARPHFARLRELLESLRCRGVVPADCVHLSMGMTQDYQVAAEEGATMVRIGSALYTGLDAGGNPHG